MGCHSVPAGAAAACLICLFHILILDAHNLLTLVLAACSVRRSRHRTVRAPRRRFCRRRRRCRFLSGGLPGHGDSLRAGARPGSPRAGSAGAAPARCPSAAAPGATTVPISARRCVGRRLLRGRRPRDRRGALLGAARRGRQAGALAARFGRRRRWRQAGAASAGAG